MRFTVAHDSHYEWHEVDGRPGAGTTIALANGGTAERVTVADQRVTHGYLPGFLVHEYQELQDAYGGGDAGLTIPEVTERYVRFLMARHAPRESWTDITQSHDELHPDLHAALVGSAPGAGRSGGKPARRPGKGGPAASYQDLSPRTSIFGSRVVRRDGTRGLWSVRHNLRTTSADWRSCLDWESKVLAGDTFVGAKGTATTAPTATTFTLDGVAAPGTTTAYNGHIVATTSGTNCYGIVLSNTNVSSPVLTIDLWHDPASPGAAAVTTPTAGAWQLLPGNAPAWYLALAHNTGVQTPATPSASAAVAFAVGIRAYQVSADMATTTPITLTTPTGGSSGANGWQYSANQTALLGAALTFTLTMASVAQATLVTASKYLYVELVTKFAADDVLNTTYVLTSFTLTVPALGYTRAPADSTPAGTDAPTRVFAGVRVPTVANVVPADSLTRTYGALRSPADAATVTAQAVTRAFAGTRAPADSTTATADAPARIFAGTRAPALPTPAGTDAVTRTYGATRTPAEAPPVPAETITPAPTSLPARSASAASPPTPSRPAPTPPAASSPPTASPVSTWPAAPPTGRSTPRRRPWPA